MTHSAASDACHRVIARRLKHQPDDDVTFPDDLLGVKAGIEKRVSLLAPTLAINS